MFRFIQFNAPLFDRIFKKGSTTYYYSSLFFPKEIRDKVATLYAFVRTADDYVDQIPQDVKNFNIFYEDTIKAFSNKPVDNDIITSFYQLALQENFETTWVIAFLESMKADTYKKSYKTFVELEKYIYGSAEVIGLMMSRIMKLPKEAEPSAQLLGKAMQLINFIRDIQEDVSLGRSYIPAVDIQCYNIPIPPVTSEEKERFSKLIEFEIWRYFEMLAEAEKGFSFIPKQYLIPIKTASDMYKWTAQEILKNPMIIFERKVKPHPSQVVLQVMRNVL